MKVKYRVVLFLALLLFVAWSRPAVYSQDRMRLGISAASLGFLPTVLAERKGFYGRYGLASEHIMVPCAIATNALLSDDLDYAVCTGPGISGAINWLPWMPAKRN